MKFNWKSYFNSLSKNIVPEELNAEQQDARMTDSSSGAAGTAPSTPEKKENPFAPDWHEEEEKEDSIAKSMKFYAKLIKAGNENLTKSINTEKNAQKEFAVQHLGKSTYEVSSPYFKLNKREELMYKSFRTTKALNRVNSIKNWINKRG